MNVSDEVQQLFALCESLLRGQQHIFTAFKHTLDLQMKEHTHTHTLSHSISLLVAMDTVRRDVSGTCCCRSVM